MSPADRERPVSVMKKGYGGVVIDAEGRVLLREPKNHFDGYVWSFPKGRPDPGETPEQTALREVREETGIEARIVGEVPGELAGGTSLNRYYLMEPVQDHGDFDDETARIAWCAPDEARERIGQTRNAKGRQRDLAVLEAALGAAPASSG